MVSMSFSDALHAMLKFAGSHGGAIVRGSPSTDTLLPHRVRLINRSVMNIEKEEKEGEKSNDARRIRGEGVSRYIAVSGMDLCDPLGG